jgi:hypothetical protein
LQWSNNHCGVLTSAESATGRFSLAVFLAESFFVDDFRAVNVVAIIVLHG